MGGAVCRFPLPHALLCLFRAEGPGCVSREGALLKFTITTRQPPTVFEGPCTLRG